ncbi:MAG: DUF3347 domain-containing protein [Flavisolibacter sp.]
MKQILFTALLVTASTLSVVAQHDHNNHQKQTSPAKTDSSAKTAVVGEVMQKKLAMLISSYYNIKNALVAGDASSAATNAGLFLRTANTIDFKVISEGNIHILSKDAGRISELKDLAKQREVFAALSSNMATIAKTLKLTGEPVYVQYCPMKKASWLSAEKEINNPYYGSAMLTCGEVKETL